MGVRGSLQRHRGVMSKTKGFWLLPEVAATRRRSSNHRAFNFEASSFKPQYRSDRNAKRPSKTIRPGRLKPLKGKSPGSKPCEFALPLLFTCVELWIARSSCAASKTWAPDAMPTQCHAQDQSRNLVHRMRKVIAVGQSKRTTLLLFGVCGRLSYSYDPLNKYVMTYPL